MKPLLVVLLVAISLAASARQARTPEVWFKLTNYDAVGGVDGPQGWNKLFMDPDEAWPDSMKNVRVIAASHIKAVPDDVLRQAFARMRQKHIAFALGSLAQSWVHEPECGHGVESYTDPPGERKLAEKIHDDGGEIAYLAMDEPLFYGHYYSGKNACHSDIGNVAERAAAVVREYQRLFPKIRIVDIEPVPGITNPPGWREDYRAWMRAFETAAGAPISALQIDINWRLDWPQGLRDAVGFARKVGLRVGVIYNADGSRGSESEWMDAAMANIHRIEAQMGIVPDQAVFQSWVKFPRRSVTDSSGLGEDFLVKKYLETH